MQILFRWIFVLKLFRLESKEVDNDAGEERLYVSEWDGNGLR